MRSGVSRRWILGLGHLDQQRLAEGAALEEVHVLLDWHQMVGRHGADQLAGLGPQMLGEALADIRVAQIAEAASVRLGRELVEVAGRVLLLQELAQDVGVVSGGDGLDLVAQHLAIGRAGRGRLRDVLQHPAPLGDADGGVCLGAGMIGHHVADHAAQLPAGVDVVAHVGHAVVGEALAADAQDRRARGFRHPAVDAVTDDVVETLAFEVKRGEVGLVDADVLELQRGDACLAVADMTLGQVDAVEAGAGETQGQRDDIAARGASQLQHARLRDGRGADAEQGGERRQSRRRRLGEGLGGVGDDIVVAGGGRGARCGSGIGHGSLAPPMSCGPICRRCRTFARRWPTAACWAGVDGRRGGRGRNYRLTSLLETRI